MMIAGDEERLRGVYWRKKAGKLYFEMRVGGGKLYSTKIRTLEEGGLCYDIAMLYCERWSESVGGRGGEGGKRKAPSSELNYPNYSPLLVLEELPKGCNVTDNKEGLMEIILRQAITAAKGYQKQAQAAAKSRAKLQKHSAQDVGSQNMDNRNASQQNAFGPSHGAKEHPDLSGVYRSNDFQKFFDVCEHFNQCKLEYTSKVNEREELERKVKDIKEDSGIISFRKSGPEKFHEHIACIKELLGSDVKLSPLLVACEQGYMSEESKCCELWKRLEVHNLKSISESLMGDGNRMTGRRRANENERLPSLLDICPVEELNSCNIPPEISSSGCLPANPPVLDAMPYIENDIAIPSVMGTDMSQPVAAYDFSLGDKFPNEEVEKLWSSLRTHTGYRREDGDEIPTEVYVNSNDGVQRHWTDVFFNMDPDD